MIGIYKITKKNNGKSYIGQSNDIYRRFNEHIRRDALPIEQAIQKYGKEAFSFEVLEECDLTELDSKEKYWINFYNTFNGFGYNCNPGGGEVYGENNGRTKMTDKDVIFIRQSYSQHKKRKEVYENFKDKITFSAFAQIWDGTTWKHIMPEVYTEKNKNFYKRQATNGELSSKAALTNEEVLECRKRYVSETAKSIYKDYENRLAFQTFQAMLWGNTYKNVPIYKKRIKKWVRDEACNDYPLLEAEQINY